jgi:hypothetical protein
MHSASPRPPLSRLARFATTAFLAFHVGSAFVLAADYYVATNGNDSNPGTLSSPWKTLGKAGATAGPGDTVYIRGGNYPVTSTQYLARSGTASAWITFKNYANEIPVFTGTNLNTTPDDAVIMVKEKSYILIDGLHVNESRGQGFSVFKGNYVTIRNCSTYLTWKSGIGVWGDLATATPSRNIKVLNNKVEKANSFDAPGADPSLAQSPHEAITFGRVEDFEIAYNEVWGGDKEGIDAKGPCKRGKIHSNLVHDQSATAIYVDGWSAAAEDIEVFNNIVRDTKTGIAVAAEGGTPLSNVRIHHNQLIRIQRVALGIGGYGSLEQGKPEGDKYDIHFVNNTVHGADHAFNTTSTKTTNVTVRNNIFSGIRYKEVVLGADVNVSAQNIQIDYNLPKTSDPKFVNAAADDLRLQSGSPAINNGHPGTAYNDPDGTRNDQGALPYGSGSGGGGTPVVIDSGDLTKFSTNTGWWSVALTDARGGSAYTSANNSANLATYTPGLSGAYSIEAYIPSGWTRASTGVNYTINHAGGSTPVTVNQVSAAGTWVRLGSGNFTLASGSTVVVSGGVVQDADSTEERALADALRFTPAATGGAVVRFEVENLPRTQSDAVTTYNEAGASGGAYDHLAANAVGDYVEYTVNVPVAGTYAVALGYKAHNSRGICQLKIDGANQGSTFDQRLNPGFQSVSLGSRQLSAGNHTFRLQVTGTSGTGYSLSADNITLTP